MAGKEQKKKEPWSVLVFGIAVVYIIFMWAKKGMAATVPGEDMVPLIAATVVVSLVKIGVIAGGILLLKWIIGKCKK